MAVVETSYRGIPEASMTLANSNPITFSLWKQACVDVTISLGIPIEDLWEDRDRYILLAYGREAWESGTSPNDFIREVFADEIASLSGLAGDGVDPFKQGEAKALEYARGVVQEAMQNLPSDSTMTATEVTSFLELHILTHLKPRL